MQAAVSRQIAQRRPANAAAVRTKRCVLQTFCKRGGQPSLSAAQSRRACRRCVRFGRRKRSFGKRRRFCLWTSPPAKVRKERLSQKDKSGAAGPERLRQGSAQTAAGRKGAFFAAGGAQDPAVCLILFTRKVRAGRLILREPSYAQSKKTPDGRRGGGAGQKSAGKNAQSRSGRPSETASAGRTRRTAETAASGGVSPAQHPPAPRQSAASRWTGKTDVFRPLRLVKEGAFSKPLRGRGFPRLLRKAERKGTKPAPAASEAGSASPQTRAGRRSAPAGLPTGRGPGTPAVPSGLRADRLFYSNCKGRFSSLFFSILIMLVPNPPRTARRKRQEGRFFLEDHH